VLALIVGFFLVCGFMVAYYRVSGLIASVSVVLLILYVLATMSMLHATMTLPGIAGITLTLGMAVDANVIIYERIREELGKGKSPRAAIEAGFEKAMSAIVDGNITTAIAGVVMLQYGSGPIKGFAVTLLIGIAATLYAAVAITRLFFEWLAERGEHNRLSI
jgi:preprotein translocase subunit SecD